MEEVWKDIAINSLPSTPIHHHIHNIHHPPPNSHLKAVILQDFLNNSNNQNRRNPTTMTSSSSSSSTSHVRTEFQFFDNCESQEFQIQLQQTHHHHSSVPSLIATDSAFDALAFGAVAAPSKRVHEGDDTDFVGRRHKRMIKNRESAARSRARKQAYISELELNVNNLKKENAMLRKLQRQLTEAPATQVPKKKGLHRSSTF